jgi:RHS repeat-associated protein
LGRPTRMTNAAKATVWSASYKPWGEVQAITGSATQNLRFPGQYFQIETGLAYNWHRSYDPVTGRYTQPDPLGFVDGPSVYAYAGNSPWMRTDRNGKETSIVIWGADSWGPGEHASIVITGVTPEGNAVYDPSGSGNCGCGSGRLATGPDAPSLGQWIDSKATVYSFATTPAEEAAIIKRAEQLGGGGIADCATNVRNALTGIGPFSKLRRGGLWNWPSTLAAELNSMPDVRVGKGDRE